MPDIEFPDLVEVAEQEGPLNVLLDYLRLGLRIPQEGRELLQAVVNAVDAEATGVVAGLYDPDVPSAVRRVLGYRALHGFVALDEPANSPHGGPLPAMVAVRVELAFEFVLRARFARQNSLQHFQLLLVCGPQVLWDLVHTCDRELYLGVSQQLMPGTLIVHLSEGLAAVADLPFRGPIVGSVAVILTAVRVPGP